MHVTLQDIIRTIRPEFKYVVKSRAGSLVFFRYKPSFTGNIWEARDENGYLIDDGVFLNGNLHQMPDLSGIDEATWIMGI